MKTLNFIVLFLALFSCKNSTNSNLDSNDERFNTSVKVDSLSDKNIRRIEISKKTNCKFEFTFNLNVLDEVVRCSFGFLILDEMEFDVLYFIKNGSTIKIVGNLLYDENWVEKEFPILWIQKEIKGQESFQGVNNLYVQFEDIYFQDDIKIKVEEMCAIENSVIAKISPNLKVQCFENIPEDFPTRKLTTNLINIPEKSN